MDNGADGVGRGQNMSECKYCNIGYEGIGKDFF